MCTVVKTLSMSWSQLPIWDNTWAPLQFVGGKRELYLICLLLQSNFDTPIRTNKSLHSSVVKRGMVPWTILLCVLVLRRCPLNGPISKREPRNEQSTDLRQFSNGMHIQPGAHGVWPRREERQARIVKSWLACNALWTVILQYGQIPSFCMGRAMTTRGSIKPGRETTG